MACLHSQSVSALKRRRWCIFQLLFFSVRGPSATGCHIHVHVVVFYTPWWITSMLICMRKHHLMGRTEGRDVMFRSFICSDHSDQMYTRSYFRHFSDLYIGCYVGCYSQTGSQVTPSCIPSIPSFLMASWVCAGSCSCLLPLIYLARPDKCKHLPGYPRHLGGRGVWMCFIFFCLIHWIDASPQSSQLGPRLLSHLCPKTRYPSACQWTGIMVDDGLLG